MGRSAEEPRGRVLVERLRSSRLVLAAAAVLAGAAVLVLDVHPAAALAAVAALVAAAAVPVDRDGRVASPVPRSTGSPWPDTSTKRTIEAISDPCILTDASGIVRFQNKAAADRLGTARPGDPLSFKLRVPELLAAVDRVGRGETAEPIHFVERVPTERFSAAFVTAIRGGRADARRRPDFVLVRLIDETELMRVDRMRGDFIANASHELRTPLSSLTGFIETLLGPARDDAANRDRFLRIMLEQAGRMARLIDDLLSLSRIEMKAHVRPAGKVDLVPLVGHVVEILGPLARDHGATVKLSLPGEPVTVRGDRDELIQVVSNLVENAVKYGRPEGTVRVSLTAEAGPDGTAGCLISVADDGPGIAPEHLPRLTERFYRVDADDSRRQKGTGLGLAIVKHIVNRHRGRLTIRSRLGDGSEFGVWLERVRPDPAAPANAENSIHLQ